MIEHCRFLFPNVRLYLQDLNKRVYLTLFCKGLILNPTLFQKNLMLSIFLADIYVCFVAFLARNRIFMSRLKGYNCVHSIKAG